MNYKFLDALEVSPVIAAVKDDEGVAAWLKHRSIPKNRAYVNTFLAKCGLNVNRPMDVISVCKGLSLNDAYWVTDAESKDTFAQCNLYFNLCNCLCHIRQIQ